MSGQRLKAFGSLKTAVDLLEKVRHDFDRLETAPDDIYSAFDFFVTAYHMLDWLHPNDRAGRETEEASEPLLQICSHLANGAKHFEATAKKHITVASVEATAGGFQRGGFQSNAFQVSGLYVVLDGNAVSLFGARLEAVDLARKVLAHWNNDARLK